MRQEQANAEDSRLDTERWLICKGSALVRFENLKWNKYLKRDETKKTPDPVHVEHVKRIFRIEGCRRFHVKHHIPAVVEQHQLDAALKDARRNGRWNGDTLPSNYAIINTRDGYPELDFPAGIECLHGRHRIQAGDEWLPLSEKWWIVDLYLAHISYELETLLIEEYANEEKRCQGEIYRKIREYHFLPGKTDSRVSPTTCVSLEMRWWAQLNESRAKKLRSLLRTTLTAGFDALAKIPGLVDSGMMITTLHTMMATQCYEEILHYLEHIWKAWFGFMRGIERGIERVDKITVKAVELRAPGISTSDADFLCRKVLGGKIFSGFSVQEREIIWENILAFKDIIPSLSKFFKDIHLLRACVDGVKWLVTVSREEVTVLTALKNRYKSRRGSQRVQTTDKTFRSEKGSPAHCFRLGYLGLFATVMRDYKDLPKPPVKKNLKEMPRAKADCEVLQRLASQAAELGFDSPEIDMLKGDSEPLPITDTRGAAALLVTTGPGEGIERRCGLPGANTFKEDRKYLFLHNLCEEKVEIGEGITSFCVLKSWFTAFFGPLQGGGSGTESPNPPAATHHQHVDEEDVDMGDAQPGSPQPQGEEQQQISQEQEPQRLDADEQMQEMIESVQRIDEAPVEAYQTLEEENTLFVPRETTTKGLATEAGTTVIRFVEREGNESDMLNPLQEYVGEVLELRVDHGDPSSHVEQQVREFLHKGKRTCDRYKRYIPENECYSVATREENKNTLFLIPGLELQVEAAGQGQVPEGGVRTTEGLGGPEAPPENIREQRERQETEHHRTPQHPTQEEDDDIWEWDDHRWEEVLDQEEENAANARILDKNTVIIHLRKRVDDTCDISKPAKDYEWTEAEMLEVPIGDPHKIVSGKMRRYWHETQIMPRNWEQKILGFDDCYRAAEEDTDHALYMVVPSAQAKWIDPSLPKPKQQVNLVNSTSETHRDKIGRGQQKTMLVGGRKQKFQNKIGMSFQEESVGIREGPQKMRTMEQPMVDQSRETKGSSQNRKIVKPRVRKKGLTRDTDADMADDYGIE